VLPNIACNDELLSKVYEQVMERGISERAMQNYHCGAKEAKREALDSLHKEGDDVYVLCLSFEFHHRIFGASNAQTVNTLS